jgi:heme/copper-type cytochrome/quinol oxidase subunit 2
MVRRAMVGAAALMVVFGVLAGCGRDPATGGASSAPPALSSGTAADGLGGSSVGSVGPPTRVIALSARGGQVSGETGRVTVPLGTPVTVSVTSDVADEIHLHGYDRKAETPAGGTASISFTANIPGVFEVELEQSKLQLLQLQVG